MGGNNSVFFWSLVNDCTVGLWLKDQQWSCIPSTESTPFWSFFLCKVAIQRLCEWLQQLRRLPTDLWRRGLVISEKDWRLMPCLAEMFQTIALFIFVLTPEVEYCIENCGTLRTYEGHCAKLRPMMHLINNLFWRADDVFWECTDLL